MDKEHCTNWINKSVEEIADNPVKLFYIATIIDFLCQMDVRRLRLVTVYADALLGKDRKMSEKQREEAVKIMEVACNV